MSKKALFFTLFFSTLISGTAYAGGGTAWGKITETYVNTNWTMVRVSGISDNPDGCSSTDYYALNPSDANYNTLHSSLLAAHMADKEIRFWLSGCGGQSNSRPHIVSVFVR